ncbi:hypothetical protein AC578_5515 [Pseudocercospora eumusae]|uniref:Uncharacterized protein n=1 Tax=Pseudocercospora eumusae TaxID=321146 RepID=A0A139H7T1_9PEZI|nr:hypothetical protein AC578_5515 [Pseudocercospora eumusae]KXS98527.1 hypothetical protein AC578_5515 [Pseudocercospora eumusae]
MLLGRGRDLDMLIRTTSSFVEFPTVSRRLFHQLPISQSKTLFPSSALAGSTPSSAPRRPVANSSTKKKSELFLYSPRPLGQQHPTTAPARQWLQLLPQPTH